MIREGTKAAVAGVPRSVMGITFWIDGDPGPLMDQVQQPEEGVGAFRYYCSPEGLITEVDLPDKWGLLWEKDGVITVVKDAERQQQNAQGEITILASIMRREGVKPRLFDYRKQNNEYEAERRN